MPYIQHQMHTADINELSAEDIRKRYRPRRLRHQGAEKYRAINETLRRMKSKMVMSLLNHLSFLICLTRSNGTIDK